MIEKDYFIEEYINKDRTLLDISKELNIPEPTLRDWLKKYNIKKTLITDILTKEAFQKEYVDNCKSLKEIAELYNLNYIQVKNLRKRYKIEKSTKDIHKATIKGMIEKYGTATPLNNSNIKQKFQETCLKKYGVDHPFKCNDIKDKIKNTNIEKYGVKNPLQNNTINNKRLQTNLERYGNSNLFEVDTIKNKALETLNNKYGVNHRSQIGKDQEILKIINNKELLKEYFINNFSNNTINEIADKIGYHYSAVLKIINENDLRDIIKFYPDKSYLEKEIIEFLKSNNIINIQTNTREILSNHLEIDIYLPDYNVGVEINGDYWHSDIFKDNNYHQRKQIDALSKNIFIYNIFEYEWKYKQDIIKSQLLNLLNKTTNKIYARNCEIKEISSKTKSLFLDKNHLQGNDKSSINLGLYNNNQLISVMTFCKARFTNKYTYELSRFCSLLNYNNVGAFSRLLKYFINNFLKDNESIVTYSNLAKGVGNTYLKNGFTFSHLSAPNYIWINLYNYDIKTRYQCQMKNEVQTMRDKKYNRIFDCGNKVWYYKKCNK